MWKGDTGSLGPWGGGGIAGMVVGSQWRSWAARVYRAAVMMWWAWPSRTMWRSVPKSFGRWAAGWRVMWARARWWAFFPPSGACVRLSPGMCWCWCFGGGGPRARDSTQWRGMACSLDLLGRMYMPGSPGTVPRYMLPVMVGGRQRLAEGRGAWGGAGRVMVLTGVVDAVRGDVYGEGSNGALEFVGLDVVEARHRPCVGAPFADPYGVCPRRRWVQAVGGDACDRAVVGGI